ncbi:hypothetical protein B0T22DRAFT_501352 [Podospora appendiculata]|uniref:Uncharacterized protein n=1 Tax=Podospora appendiculata TaxID=314037 RepID=A0AAE0X3T1_9PEZI|nr:hypothetical protein B0T22DRAFT_501352 [Podospora appendiculata]
MYPESFYGSAAAALNTSQNSQAIFSTGSELGVQEWLAVVGAGFSLLSFGLVGAYNQIFNFWCSNQAARTRGLDYARYLNSQPSAPVLFGFRGFPGFVVGRYIVVALGIAASVSYKFAVIEVTIKVYEHMEPSKISLRLPPMHGLVDNGTASPWLGDGPTGRNRAFCSSKTPTITPQRPSSLDMVGWADCNNALHTFESGWIYTREIVAVANKTEEDGEFFMAADPSDWTRVKGLGRLWINTAEAVVDYRISSPGILQIQWAQNGSWLNDGSQKQPVGRRITYSISLAIAEVRRLVSSGDCSWISNKGGEGNLPSIQLFGQRTIPMMAEQGVSLLVRSAMAAMGAQLAAMNSTKLGHAPKYPEQSHQTQWPFGPSYNGTRSTSQTGSYYGAAAAFGIIGLLAYLVSLVRIMLRPSELTSWMGQHMPALTFDQIWKGPPAKHHYIPPGARGISGSLTPFM